MMNPEKSENQSERTADNFEPENSLKVIPEDAELANEQLDEVAGGFIPPRPPLNKKGSDPSSGPISPVIQDRKEIW